MSAALSTTPILPRLRAAGADVILKAARPTIRHASLVPSPLMAEARARRHDLLAELLAEADIDAAAKAEERAAIMAEGSGDPAAAVAHEMPVSWANPTIEPTPGARCRCCQGTSWWCEAVEPRGWRCSSCHPPTHLPADRRRTVRT